MTFNKAFRFRIYPNAEHRTMFAKTFGCVRVVYNELMKEKLAYYKQFNKQLINTPAHLKQREELFYLKEVDSMALCNAQLHAQQAFTVYMKDKIPNKDEPKRKKKRGKQSYTTNNQNGTVRIEDGHIRLPKVGFVRIKLHRDVPNGYKIKSVTISQEPSGKYYASILTEYEKDAPEIVPATEDNSIGLDYSSPHFYVDSNGDTADMPHFYREAKKRLAREQRKLSKMVKCSNNYKKQKIRVALAYEKVRNARADWQHKKSKELADKYSIIAVEGINYQDMARGLKLAKSTNDNSFGQFRTFLAYKLADKGGRLVTIDKWFPSTKTCGVCGAVNSELTLADRAWTCPHCGTHHDRDLNAARNIRDKGLSMIA